MIRKLQPNEQAPMHLLLLADPSQEIVVDYLKRGICFIAEQESQIVGVYVLLATKPHTVELVNVAVEPAWQGKGVGKKLVFHAIEMAKKEGYKTIEVGTGNSSLDQLGLYQKCGFRMVNIDHNFFLRHYDEEIYENGIQCVDMVRLSKWL